MKDSLDKDKAGRADSEELRTYCPWCVGSEESARLQNLGYTSRVCEEHLAELLRQAKRLMIC